MRPALLMTFFTLGLMFSWPGKLQAETDAYAVKKGDATYIYDYYEGEFYDNDIAAVLYNTDDDWFYDYYYLREDVESVDYDYDYFDGEYDWEVEYDWD